MMKSYAWSAAILAAVALMSLVAGDAAWAQTASTPYSELSSEEAFNLFGTEFGDAFTSTFLNQLFGPLFPSADGSAMEPVFSRIIGYFNVIMLVVAGILFFYNVSIGIAQTAHEGSVLGNRWSSLWAPLRVIFAVGLLVPMPGLGGYNIAHAGVAYIVRGSTMVASFIWRESATMVLNGDAPLSAEPARLKPDVVEKMFNNAACKAIVNEQMRLAATASGQTALRVSDLPPQENNGSLFVNTAIIANGEPIRQQICGSYTTPEVPAYISRIDAEENDLGIDKSNQDAIIDAFNTAHRDTIATLQANMDALAASMLPTMMDPVAPAMNITSQIQSAHQQANQQLSAGIAATVDLAVGSDGRANAARNSMRNRITGNCASNSSVEDKSTCYGEGWMGAGSWYIMMARLNNEIAGLTSASPNIGESTYFSNIDLANREMFLASGGQSGWFGGTQQNMDNAGLATQEEALRAMTKYQASFTQSSQALAAMGYTLSTGAMSELGGTVVNDSFISSWLGSFGSFDVLIGRFVEWISPGNWAEDPMIGLINIGKLLVSLGAAGIAVLGVSSTSILGVGVGAGPAIAGMPLILPFLMAGGLITFILPLMPFMFWVLGVTGYFLLVTEALISVNLWALAHMRMDGDGISGEAGRQGWLMLLSLMLTPVLMIFGFLIGMGIFRVTSALIDVGIAQALTGLIGVNPFIAIIGFGVYAILIAIFYMVLIERSFALVTEFPGRVMAIMGASAQITNGEENRARTAAGVAIGGGAFGMRGAVQSLGGRAAKQRELAKHRGAIGSSGPKDPA